MGVWWLYDLGTYFAANRIFYGRGEKAREGVLNYYTGNYSMLEEGMIERAERYRRSLSNNIKSDVDSYYYIRKNDLGLVDKDIKNPGIWLAKVILFPDGQAVRQWKKEDLVNRRWLKRPTGKGKNKKYWIGDNCAKTCDEEQTQLNKVTDRSHT